MPKAQRAHEGRYKHLLCVGSIGRKYTKMNNSEQFGAERRYVRKSLFKVYFTCRFRIRSQFSSIYSLRASFQKMRRNLRNFQSETNPTPCRNVKTELRVLDNATFCSKKAAQHPNPKISLMLQCRWLKS